MWKSNTKKEGIGLGYAQFNLWKEDYIIYRHQRYPYIIESWLI